MKHVFKDFVLYALVLLLAALCETQYREKKQIEAEKYHLEQLVEQYYNSEYDGNEYYYNN